MSNNLWEVKKLDDLRHLLLNETSRPIILLVTPDFCDDKTKSLLRKYIKIQTRKFTDMLFLYFTSNKDDHGKLNPILSNDINEYPKIFCIKDSRNILMHVSRADNTEILNEFFNLLNEQYQNIIEYTVNNDTSNNETTNNNNNNNTNNNAMNNTNNATNEQIQNQPQMNQTNQVNQMYNMQINRRKTINKINSLKERYEIMLKKFMKDCKSRQKKENKILALAKDI